MVLSMYEWLGVLVSEFGIRCCRIGCCDVWMKGNVGYDAIGSCYQKVWVSERNVGSDAIGWDSPNIWMFQGKEGWGDRMDLSTYITELEGCEIMFWGITLIASTGFIYNITRVGRDHLRCGKQLIVDIYQRSMLSLLFEICSIKWLRIGLSTCMHGWEEVGICHRMGLSIYMSQRGMWDEIR